MFTCSPIQDDEKSLVKLAKKMKKLAISIDFVAFGELESETTQKLSAFNENVKGGDGSHLEIIPAGPNLLSDKLVGTPILGGDPDSAPSGSGVNGGAGGGDGTNGFEFGIDPSLDPELAMALRMSYEEEQNRLEKARQEQAEKEGRPPLEGIPEEGQPLLDKDGEPSGQSKEGEGSESKKDDGDKMDTA